MAKNITKIKHRFPLRQLRLLPRKISHHWPVPVLILTTLLLSFLNYEPGTFFIGWDNLPAEFDPPLNLQRSIFAVWQEYQSLGLLGGMSHAADLPRQIVILLLSYLPIPLDLIRYLSTFFPLILGPLGTYFFLDRFVFKNKLDAKTGQTASFFGGFFYLLNLATMQTFYAPFETFIYFYGAFPWLIFFLVRFFRTPTPKNLFIFFLISVLATPAFYIETLFVVYGLTLLALYIFHRPSIKTVILSGLAVLVANLFWLLPVVLFVLTNGQVGELSKINTISTPETYARNLEFGNLPDLALLKGYWFNFVDLSGGTNKFDYLLSTWRSHLSTPVISLIGYLLFLISAIGFYYALNKKFRYSIFAAVTTAICVFFLIGGSTLINTTIPLVGELFRSPFTKFSTPLSFAYAYFFSVGCIFLLDLFSYLHNRLTHAVTLFTVLIAILIYMSPAFSGNFLSPSMRRSIPTEYFELFDFFRKQDPATRIANFPQNDFWGWLYYDWGYRGSGFLWYGIKQPILDRAFDVWSRESQVYYEEINSAIYSEDWDRFDHLISKYSINWLLIDHHVIAPEGRVDLKTKELEEHLSTSPNYSLSTNLNNTIFVYESKVKNNTKNFISASTKSTSITPFDPPKLRPNTSLTLTSNSVVFPSITLTNTKGFTLDLPSLSKTESLLPVEISYQKAYGVLSLKLTTQAPQITLNDQDVSPSPSSTTVSIPVTSSTESLILQINQDFFELQLPAEITEFIGYYPIGSTYLPANSPFAVILYDGSPQTNFDLTSDLKLSTPYQCYTDKPNRKIEKISTGESVALLGTDVVGCLSAQLPQLNASGVYSVDFSYYSPTLTPGNVSITTLNLGSENTAQPLETTAESKHTRIFAQASSQPQKLNLILEGNEAKSIQEIDYSNINLYFHPLLFSANASLNQTPSKTITFTENTNRLSIATPLLDSAFDIVQTPNSNQLLPEARNCDQFNDGLVKKTITPDGFIYESSNGIECDYLNLRHLPHGLSYLISFDYRYQTGLPMTLCLENHTTRRCDIYERLTRTDKIQSLIQPIRNTFEDQGFTLHLFNQSVGGDRTLNTIKNLSLHPVPLGFLQNISINSPIKPKQTTVSTTHPNEYIYTASSNLPEEKLLNLYQSKSPFWIALSVDKDTLAYSPLKLITSIPHLYFNHQKLVRYDTGVDWYNSWTLPEGEHHILIFYAPQYLEFAGFLLIALSLTGSIIYFLFTLTRTIKNRLAKTKRLHASHN